MTFTAKCNGSGTDNQGNTWTITSDGTESTFDSNLGIHYGTNNSAVSYITLSTSGISGTITQIVVNAAKNSKVSTSSTVSVTVGGADFGSSQTMSNSSATDYTFTGNASGEIIVTVKKPSSANRALYVKSVTVTYTPDGGSTTTKTATKLAFASGDQTYTVGDATTSFTNVATLTDNSGNTISDQTVSYAVSDNTISASVDANGVVTFSTATAGSATITASYAGDDDTYAAASTVSYTITVKEASSTGEGAGWTYTFAAGDLQDGTTSYTFNGTEDGTTVPKTWTFTPTWNNKAFFNSNLDNQGLQIGSKDNSAKTLVFSSNDFAGTITKVVVNASTASNATATVSVTVGGDTFGDDASLSLRTSAADYTFEGSASGDVVITISQSTKRALYIKRIDVYYSASGTTTTVTAPTISDQSSNHKVAITIPDGTTVYYTTDGTSPLNSDGTLSGSVHTYVAGDSITLTKATTIQAVAMDADGNFSKVVSKNFAYNGEVTVPYYEEFLTELGNFTVETSAYPNYGSPVWEIHSNDASSQWGKRQYAWATGWDISSSTSLRGQTRLISPVIDLTDGGGNDFTDAYFYFEHKCGYFLSDSLKVKCTVWIKESSSDTWTQIDPESITWPTSVSGNTFTETNSGNISLKGYLNKKIQISFLFHNYTYNNSGTWNLDYIYVNAMKQGETNETEAVTTNGGLVTYVTKRKVNWVATRDKGKSTTTDDEGNTTTKYNVRGFKVTEFDANTVVLVEFGTGASGSEQYTPQNTPIVLKGATDDQSKHEVYLTVYDTDATIDAPAGNLLRASYNDVTAQDGERLFVMQKINGTYGWHKLATGRTVPDRKAYLNGIDEKTQVSSTESDPLQGKYVSFDDIEDSSTVTGITDVNSEQPRVNDGVFYNLQGMRVENPTHGIYIVNGKKVIIK